MRRLLAAAAVVLLVLYPLIPPPEYQLHLVILILIWAFIGTAWSLMGRFGLVSLGHGAFLGVGVYTMTLLWNYYDLFPWAGAAIGVGLALVLALIVGYPAFRFGVVGHYFALVTLALGEVVRLSIIAARDVTGGSLGMTPQRAEPATDVSWYALQFTEKIYFFYIALAVWLIGLYIWHRVDRSMIRSALEAISEDEVASAAIGVHVTRLKLRVTLISAAMTAVGGIMMGQYHAYLNPTSLSGIAVSLEIVFATIVGGMYNLFGPTAGAVISQFIRESLRTYFGTSLVGAAETIYGLVLILIIIFMPRGIFGFLAEQIRRRREAAEDAAEARAGGNSN